jgi:dissimilatory sulfite reductase related protein
MILKIPERDEDGYLLAMDSWTAEIGRAMAEADEVELDEIKWTLILKAREYYEENAVVPPIRAFAKHIEEEKNCIQAIDDRLDETRYQI